MIRTSRSSRRRRGGALLSVLWLSAALSAIVFSVASSVRSETERSSTLVDGLHAQYLASGAIQLAIQRSLIGDKALPRMKFEFPTGVAIVEIIPETARLNLNEATAEDLFRLLVALGAEPERARQAAVAIAAGRPAGRPAGQGGPEGLPPGQSFPGVRASFEEVEEALLVPGMTPDLFYGNWTRAANGRLVRLGAFRDCVSIYGSRDTVDVNGVEPALLVAFGASRQAAERLVQLRQVTPILDLKQLGMLAAELGPAAARLRVGGNTIFTFRATARRRTSDGRLSDLSRSVAAQVKFRKQDQGAPFHILRWYDNITSEVSQWQ